MKRIALVLATLLPGLAAADDWVPLSGPEIQQALTDRKLQYENAWQDFRASGRTLYNAGQDSWGYWNVRDDQYCSMWPPSDIWACFAIERSGNKIRFTGSSNDITEGVYAD